MKWVKRRIIRWINQGLCESDEPTDDTSYHASTKGGCGIGSSSPRSAPQLNFRIYSAVNGQILEFNRYSTVTDREETTVYLVEKNENIGDYVSKCLTVESMR